MLWVTGTNDVAFPMDSLQKSTVCRKGHERFALPFEMIHAHGGPGEKPPEILAFADAILNRGTPLTKLTGQGSDATTAWATFDSKTKAIRAELIYTTDVGPFEKRELEIAAGDVRPSRRQSVGDVAGEGYDVLPQHDRRPWSDRKQRT